MLGDMNVLMPKSVHSHGFKGGKSIPPLFVHVTEGRHSVNSFYPQDRLTRDARQDSLNGPPQNDWTVMPDTLRVKRPHKVGIHRLEHEDKHHD